MYICASIFCSWMTVRRALFASPKPPFYHCWFWKSRMCVLVSWTWAYYWPPYSKWSIGKIANLGHDKHLSIVVCWHDCCWLRVVLIMPWQECYAQWINCNVCLYFVFYNICAPCVNEVGVARAQKQFWCDSDTVATCKKFFTVTWWYVHGSHVGSWTTFPTRPEPHLLDQSTQ